MHFNIKGYFLYDETRTIDINIDNDDIDIPSKRTSVLQLLASKSSMFFTFRLIPTLI